MEITSYHPLMPNELNSIGIVFGGVISSEVDKIAAILARKILKTDGVLTVASYYNFINSAYSGETLKIVAKVDSIGEKSVGIFCEVFSFLNNENENRKIANCYLVFVGKNKDGSLIKMDEKFGDEEIKEMMKNIGKKLNEKSAV